MSRSEGLQRWREEKEESDEDDVVFLGAMLAALKRKKNKKKFRGSLSGRHNVPRDILGGHEKIYWDYFADKPVYNEKHFRRRYRMSRALFLRIVAAVEAHDEYFRQKADAVGRLGASAIQKVVAPFLMLAHGVSADFLDDSVRMGESTIIESFKHFVKAVVNIFSEEYLRAPNAQDTARLLAINKERGFPGMLGSIDCMHWRWEKCPVAWQGVYTGHKNGPTLILEAVASQDLWIWHAFFGLPGSFNDINVLRRSPLFDRVVSGTAPQVEYMVNGNKYTMGYYLADGIYPAWAPLVKAFRNPQGNKKVHFTTMQESYRKDVERAFGVLQSRFAMIRGPARWWSKDDLWYIMMCCVILHNMIIEDEREEDEDFNYYQEPGGLPELAPEDYQTRDPILVQEFLKNHKAIEDKSAHEQLRNDLVEHLWAVHSSK